ncbi:hypothetical protein I4U23_027297 [Adineta vaga]|nr:hypothetical protein I4U23_027297 [Adineta vaga]
MRGVICGNKNAMNGLVFCKDQTDSLKDGRVIIYPGCNFRYYVTLKQRLPGSYPDISLAFLLDDDVTVTFGFIFYPVDTIFFDCAVKVQTDTLLVKSPWTCENSEQLEQRISLPQNLPKGSSSFCSPTFRSILVGLARRQRPETSVKL